MWKGDAPVFLCPVARAACPTIPHRLGAVPMRPTPGTVGYEGGVLQQCEGTYCGVQPLLTFTTASDEWQWTGQPPISHTVSVQVLGHTALNMQPALTGLTCPGGMGTACLGMMTVRCSS